MIKYTNLENAVALIKSNDNVYLHSAAATPKLLVEAMAKRSHELSNVKLYSIHTEWEATYALPEHCKSFEINAFFVGSNIRAAINDGRANYIPMFLSEIPKAFRSGAIPLDVALISVSTPDERGYCTLGVSCDIAKSAIDTAKIIIAEVNPNMPKIWGAGVLHISQIDAMVEVDYPIYEAKPAALSEQEIQIGKHVASLVEDGATLQMGIGGIPNAVLQQLTNHKDLGIHTEMFSDGIVDLVEKGIITGKYKKVHPGTIISGFCIGSKKLYDFLNENLMVRLLEIEYVNNPHVIAKNPKVTAINSAIEVDILGQICADSIGSYQYSGVGGQVDFMRGAALSDGGKPILALPSITHKGISKIVSTLKPGASVVTTRSHVHYIVTENGIAHLWGKNLKQRAKVLIDIAHPSAQEQLEREAYEIIKQTIR